MNAKDAKDAKDAKEKQPMTVVPANSSRNRTLSSRIVFCLASFASLAV